MPTVSRLRNSLAVTAILAATSGCLTELEAADGNEPPSESIAASALSGRANIHRAFKGRTGEHFYTADANEAAAAGFQIEALNYYGLGTTVTSGAVPFFRCFWQTVGKHFYTVQANCETPQARNEGQLGFIATGQDPGTVPLFRLYQPSSNDHFYTIDNQERLLAIFNNGYRDEGIAGFVLPSSPP